MAKKEVKKDEKEVKKEEKELKKAKDIVEEAKPDDFEHLDKRTSKYKKLLERYKKRNRLVEVVIACIIIVIVFFVSCNKTFLKTNFTMKVENSVISIDLPRFTYYIGSDDNKIVFKTLRKSENTRAFFEDFLNSEKFDIYYCNNSDTPYYYSNEGKYFIYDIEVKKVFAVKTVTVNYTTTDYDSFCSTVSDK